MPERRDARAMPRGGPLPALRRGPGTLVTPGLSLGAVAAAVSSAVVARRIRRHSAVRVDAFVLLAPVFGVRAGRTPAGEAVSFAPANGALLVDAGGLMARTDAP